MAQLIDTHCHLDFHHYADDLDDVLARAAEANVGRVVAPAVDMAGCRAVISLAQRHEPVLAAVGVHPNSSAGLPAGWLDELRELAQHERVVAIGEIGLDYYRDRSPKSVQYEVFEAQLVLAQELNLPVIIHNRQADEDVLQCLGRSERDPGRLTGVLHSFSGPWATASAALDMGYYLGFTGPITFKKAEELRAVAAQVPLERLLVETDGPFLTPHPYRGKRNEPAYVRFVAQRLAELKQMPEADFVRQSSANAARLFGAKVAVNG